MISRTCRRITARSGSTRTSARIGEATTVTDPGVLQGCPTWPEEFARRYREAGYWTGETFGSMLRDRAAAHGERPAIVDGDRHITYGELDVRADRLAAGLRKQGNRKPQSTAARRAGQGRGKAVALASIAPYRVPQTSELPANRVDWTPDAGRAVLLIHDVERHFVDAFPPGEAWRVNTLVSGKPGLIGSTRPPPDSFARTKRSW